MEIFHIGDVVSVLGLPKAPYGRSDYYIPCPECDGKQGGKHLNINLKKDVFRCPRCNISGGIFDLYALFTGVPRERVRGKLVEALGSPESVKHIQYKRTVKALQKSEDTENECRLSPVDVRDKTYRAFLAKLSLASDHRDNLRNRGLTDEEIDSLGYKTLTSNGLTGISNCLSDNGIVLKGVPGFFLTKDGAWSFSHTKRGILVPVRDRQGRIQGMQLRLDDELRRKYRWISSSGMNMGCRAFGWTHLAGEPTEKILLTEGPMKADIIHALKGLTVLAVPGVNALTELEKSLLLLKECGTRQIMTAFDMDMSSNPYVQSGYMKLLELIDKMGFKFGTYLWDGKYKGLDDYIWEYLMQCKRL